MQCEADVPALEDKIVQQAVRMVLEPIYEAEFVGFSYGFRPRRSAHDALDALAEAIGRKVNWVLDADIRAFYDTINHGWLQRFLEHRIGDRRLVRLLMKWAKAGVMVDGELHEVHEGSPQGAVISPLLSNIFLQMRKALAERLAKFGLDLHPDKTRVLEFGYNAPRHRAGRGQLKPDTFEFLGFVHIIGKSRRGAPMLCRWTSRKKRQAKLARLTEECRKRRHVPVAEQHAWLCQVLKGHYRYYGVPTNSTALRNFCHNVKMIWYRVLQRRSQRARWTAARRDLMDARFPLPNARLYHPWPRIRFRERHPLR